MLGNENSTRIESKEDVKSFLSRLAYVMAKKTKTITFQKIRDSDKGRNPRFTNRFTIACLFPDESPVEAIARELQSLNFKEYRHTIKDNLYPDRSEWRVFSRKYAHEPEHVYIKLRVDIISSSCRVQHDQIYVMSFHFSDRVLSKQDFPYLE